jgi:hypothetical protein
MSSSDEPTKVQIRPEVVARIGHRGFCYGRQEGVSRKPLLSLKMPEIAIVSARRRTQEYSTKVWNSLPNVLLSLERPSEGIRFLSARRGPAIDHGVKTQYRMIDI